MYESLQTVGNQIRSKKSFDPSSDKFGKELGYRSHTYRLPGFWVAVYEIFLHKNRQKSPK